MDDPIILEAMGLAGASLEEISARILKRNEWVDLAGSAPRINIYFRPSRATRNMIVTNEVLQADSHVPAQKEYLAYRITGRIKKLIHNYEINGRKYYFDGQLGDLPTMPSFVCVGSRYCFYATF